jgi:sugar lactone lactonase YvrE
MVLRPVYQWVLCAPLAIGALIACGDDDSSPGDTSPDAAADTDTDTDDTDAGDTGDTDTDAGDTGDTDTNDTDAGDRGDAGSPTPEDGGGADDESDGGTGDGDASTPEVPLDVGGRVVEMTEERFFPEGVSVDKDGNFYMGSMWHGSIYTAKADDGEAVPFIEADENNGLISIIGVYADDANNTLWVCSSDAGNADLSGSGAVAIKAFEMVDEEGVLSGEFLASYDWPEPSQDVLDILGEDMAQFVEDAEVNGFCNDMTVDADGNLYATDSWYPRILRLPAGGDELEEWIVSDIFPTEDAWHLNGIDIDQSSGMLYAVENHPGTLYSIEITADGSPGAVAVVDTSRDLLSPDGLKVIAPNLLLTAEGGNMGGGLALIWLGEDGEVEELIPGDDYDKGFNGIATFALHQASAWLVENQGDHFWGPDDNGPDADPPFRLVEIPLAVGAGGDNIEIETEGFFPEGSTVDADGNFYVGSMNLGSIVKLIDGTPENFIEADEENGLVSVLGLFADDDNGTLWVCSSDAGNGQLAGAAPVAVKAFDLETGDLTGSWDWPPPSQDVLDILTGDEMATFVDEATVNGFCNDVTVAADGTLYATDSWYPRILTLEAGADENSELEEWVVSDVFPTDSPWHLNGIAIDEDARRLYAVENHPGTLYSVPIQGNGNAGMVTPISSSRPLLSPDGLKVISEDLLAAAEGQHGGMVLIEIDGDSGTVRRVSTGLDGIATFALTGEAETTSAWLVENQGDHFWGGDGMETKPFRLVEVPMGL